MCTCLRAQSGALFSSYFRDFQNITVLLCLCLKSPSQHVLQLRYHTISALRAFQNLGLTGHLSPIISHSTGSLLFKITQRDPTKLTALSSIARSLGSQEPQLHALVSHLSTHPPETLQMQPLEPGVVGDGPGQQLCLTRISKHWWKGLRPAVLCPPAFFPA